MGSATLNARSVNQRYLEVSFVCRSNSVALNLSFASVSVRPTRGKVECNSAL
ncbi:hypothetical protein ACNKHM_13075 [Shigella sonnei]